MAGQSVTIAGASYSDVPGVTLNKTGGGTAYFADVSDTTATASDVASGKYFYTAAGVKTAGTATGGGGAITITDVANTTGTTAQIENVTATHHVIHLEFSDSTDTDIDVYYDDALLGTMISAYNPSGAWTYNSKTVVEAQLDGTTFYDAQNIPIGVELVDMSKATEHYVINSNGEAVPEQWYFITDYIAVAPGMTFSYTGCLWYYIGIYDENKQVLRTVYIYNDATQNPSYSNLGDGTLSGNELTNAAFVRITSTSGYASLIRTA